ncbi:hypothetical protein LUZ60_003224 [Juncus effusus]|nr:hypothetical protein LUZ60_003224 [Juncus effusus]
MAAVDASPRPENLDPNPDSGNPSSTPNQNSSTAENHNPASLSNPSPSINPHPSTPVQAPTPPIGTPSFASPYAHIGGPQYAAVSNPNPSFQMGQAAGLQPPGVGSPAIVGSSAGSPASPMMRPIGMYQAVPGQHPVQMQYGQVQNGYMAAGAIPPPGVPRFPSQYPGLIRPGFAPRPIPQIMRPNIAGIRPAPPMAPLLRPVNPVPVEKPQTTVYVGKIAPTVDNDFLLSLLKLCGPVKSWKRAQDPSDGKPKGFGFCEFEGAEGILRALRLLSKLNLDGQELVLNINQATREYLEKYVEKKTEREKFKETESLLETSDPTQIQTEPPKSAAEESKKESSDSPKDSSKDSSKDPKDEAQKFGVVSDEDRKADKEAVEKIESMLEERAKSLPPPPPLPPNADSANRTEIPSRVKDDWDSDQIRSGEKNSEGDVSESNKGGNEVEASSGRSRRERSRERERERSNRDKEREREKEREADRYERDRERDRVKREREREDRVRQSDRQLKDRLKDWENREREREYQRHHERDREKERERERKREVVKQEDESEDEGYNNNERDRKRRRRGGNNNSIEERKRKRQREKEEDVSDRLKEEEETEEQMRRERELEKERLLREEEMEKEKELENEKEEQLKREMYVKDVWNEMYGPAKEERESVEPMQVDLDTDNNSNNSNTNNNSSNGELAELGQENVDTKLITNTTTNNGATKKLGFGLFGSGKKASVPSVFQQEEEEEQNDKKMRPLVPIDYSAEELQAVSQTDSNEEAAQTNNVNAAKKEKKKGETKKVLDAKQLIDMIPKTKEELFSYPINWTVYDKHGLNERMRPWISKKITEFLGEEEETLVDYIVSCTRDHVEASKLLELLQAILDEEAEMFVLKMWRMLIFEIKKVETGIAKGK